LLIEALLAERISDSRLADRDRWLHGAWGHGRRCLAQQLAELALELAYARFPRVLTDDQLERDVVDRHLVLAQACPLTLARPEIAARDRDLLVDRVTVEADDLHAV